MSINPSSLFLHLYPQEILRVKAAPVDVNDSEVHEIAHKMIELMYEFGGAGLAAPQVGLPWRLFVTINPDSDGEGIAWLNPELEITNSMTELEEEGCLSLPELRCAVRRPVGICISGYDLAGNAMSAESEDFIARVWQHENDHLDGILILDKMSAMDRLVNRKLIKRLKQVE